MQLITLNELQLPVAAVKSSFSTSSWRSVASSSPRTDSLTGSVQNFKVPERRYYTQPQFVTFKVFHFHFIYWSTPMQLVENVKYKVYRAPFVFPTPTPNIITIQ